MSERRLQSIMFHFFLQFIVLIEILVSYNTDTERIEHKNTFLEPI